MQTKPRTLIGRGDEIERKKSNIKKSFQTNQCNYSSVDGINMKTVEFVVDAYESLYTNHMVQDSPINLLSDTLAFSMQMQLESVGKIQTTVHASQLIVVIARPYSITINAIF